jgi:hypothetical protein
MPVVSQLPGDLTIQLVAGDEMSFTLDFDIDLTNYTFSAGVYVASSSGFQGGGNGVVTTAGATAITPTITVSNAASGIITWNVGETQTASLAPGIKYRHYVRWVAPGSITRTVVSGDLVVKAP